MVPFSHYSIIEIAPHHLLRHYLRSPLHRIPVLLLICIKILVLFAPSIISHMIVIVICFSILLPLLIMHRFLSSCMVIIRIICFSIIFFAIVGYASIFVYLCVDFAYAHNGGSSDYLHFHLCLCFYFQSVRNNNFVL